MKGHAIYNGLQVHGAPDIRVLFPPIWGQEHDIQGKWFNNHSTNKANKLFGGDWTLPPQKENRNLVWQSKVNVKQFQLNSWKLVEQCKFCQIKESWWKNRTNLVILKNGTNLLMEKWDQLGDLSGKPSSSKSGVKRRHDCLAPLCR